MINIHYLDNPPCHAAARELMEEWEMENYLLTSRPLIQDLTLLEAQLKLAKSLYQHREQSLMRYYDHLVENSNLSQQELNRRYEKIINSLERDARKYRELKLLLELYR